jgi:hypothetical protein
MQPDLLLPALYAQEITSLPGCSQSHLPHPWQDTRSLLPIGAAASTLPENHSYADRITGIGIFIYTEITHKSCKGSRLSPKIQTFCFAAIPLRSVIFPFPIFCSFLRYHSFLLSPFRFLLVLTD